MAFFSGLYARKVDARSSVDSFERLCSDRLDVKGQSTLITQGALAEIEYRDERWRDQRWVEVRCMEDIDRGTNYK